MVWLIGIVILPNGKLIYHNDILYQSNLLKLLNQNDYNDLINTNVKCINGSYIGNGNESRTIILNFEPYLYIGGTEYPNYQNKIIWYKGLTLQELGGSSSYGTIFFQLIVLL